MTRKAKPAARGRWNKRLIEGTKARAFLDGLEVRLGAGAPDIASAQYDRSGQLRRFDAWFADGWRVTVFGTAGGYSVTQKFSLRIGGVA
jgi:hypothetical protein